MCISLSGVCSTQDRSRALCNSAKKATATTSYLLVQEGASVFPSDYFQIQRMKAVGKVSARSQTATPDQQIMKRRKPASSNARPSRKAKATAQSAEIEGGEPRKQPNTRKRRRLVRDSHEDVGDEWNDEEEEEEEEEETEVLASRGPTDAYPPLNLSHGVNLRSSAIHTHPLDSPSDAEGSMDERTVPEHKGAAKKPKYSKDAFKCPFCDHRSGRPNNLVIHINSKHFEENPPRTCSAEPAECIGESILYFLSTKREFEEKIAILEGQVSLCSKTLQEVLGELTGEQRMNLREKAEKQQNRFLANLLG